MTKNALLSAKIEAQRIAIGSLQEENNRLKSQLTALGQALARIEEYSRKADTQVGILNAYTIGVVQQNLGRLT